MMARVAPSQGKLFPERKVAQGLAKAQGYLESQGIAAYLVGGYLRDHLLGRPSRDIDLTVAGDGLGVARGLSQILKGKLVVLDEVGGVARIVLGRKPQQWHLDISGFAGSIQEDLARRDFTVDAMALGLGEALSLHSRQALADLPSFYDPFGGRRDTETGLVRAVSESAFPEDPVRLLRAVRLASQLEFSLEPGTARMVQRNAPLITTVAGERLREELNGIIAPRGAGQATLCLDSLGLLEPLLPELVTCQGVAQPKEHHWDVFRHSIEALSATEGLLRQSTQPQAALEAPWDEGLEDHFQQEVASGVSRGLLLKWTALFHDLGKPSAKTVEAGGRIRFLGHSQVGAGQARAILERLRFSSREADHVAALVEHHLRPGQLLLLGQLSRRAVYRYFRDAGDVGLDAIFLFLADYLATSGPALNLEQWRQDLAQVTALLAQYFQERETISPPKLLDGHDIMKHFHLPPGPHVGKLLEAVREAQATREVSSREEALALVEHTLRDLP
ncbi:MAG: HD domain-containing protein [Chloroflexi bacterium]|nr:HD domain-containing protein [Chloroflexota bacterium]